MPQAQERSDISLDDVRLLIRKTGNDMRRFVKSLSAQPADMLFRNLRTTVEKIGSSPVRRPPPLERYMRQWSDFAAGRTKQLDRGTMRYLCWEPEIATSNQFLAYLESSGMELTRRPLEGLVRSCHSKWEAPFSGGPSVEIVRSLVARYRGPNPVIAKWKSNPEAILGEGGPNILARNLVDGRKSLHAYLKEWCLESQSLFVRALVEAATVRCRRQLSAASGDVIGLLFGELLPWPGWDLPAFKKAVGACILHESVTNMIQELLETFVLTHKELGDPRLPGNHIKWAEVPQEARDRMLQWLCRERATFFFDHVYREDEGWGWQRRNDSMGSVRFGYPA